MVPSGVGQLEFESEFPVNPSPPFPKADASGGDHSQLLTFYKNDLDFSQHGSMPLHSRNGLGIWEPKVASGYGYVVRADSFNFPGIGTTGVGIPNLVDISIVDTVKPNISANPFYVQVGICYTGTNGKFPADNFTVTHGYKSWGGGNYQPADMELRKYFNQLIDRTDASQYCNNLDSQSFFNKGLMFTNLTGCPADGVTLGTNSVCPMPITDQQGNPACLFPKNTPPLTESTTGIAGMTTNGMLNGPPNLDKFSYDSTTGMLYLWIAQTDPNAVGPSPLGNCTGSSNDPAFCPQSPNGLSTGEAYYNCPAEGCPTYRIAMNDASYTPGTSACPVFGSTGDANGWATGTGGNTWPGPPANQPAANQPALVYKGTKTVVARTTPTANPLPHYAPASAPVCATTQP
jgi:hypothetical protein